MKKLISWAAIAALALSLLFVAAHIEWLRFGEALMSVDPSWGAASVLATIASIYLRALRWAVAIPLRRRIGSVWTAVNIGYLANLVFPLRAGEIFRVGILSQLTGAGLSRVTAAALVDRACDGFYLVVFLACAMAWHGADVLGDGTAWGVVIWSSVAVTAVALSVVFAGRIGRNLHELAGRLPSVGLVKQTITIMVALFGALDGIGSMRRLAAIMAAGGAAAVLDVIGAYFVILAFGLDISPLAALTFVVFIWIGFALPLVPGALGLYQVAGVLALAAFEVSLTDALAVTIVCQVVANGVILIQGVGGAVYFGVGLFGRSTSGRRVTEVEG